MRPLNAKIQPLGRMGAVMSRIALENARASRCNALATKPEGDRHE